MMPGSTTTCAGDPDELNNRIDDPRVADRIAKLEAAPCASFKVELGDSMGQTASA